MKKSFLFFVGTSFLLTSCVQNPEGEKAETKEAQEVKEVAQDETSKIYQLNPEESNLVWTGRKVSATHHGNVNFKSGTLHLEGDKISGGNFVVDMTSITNEDLEGEWNDKLVEHLHSDDFFSIEAHPETTFEITEVKDADAEGKIAISGNLTIKGISKNITFNADLVEVSDSKVQLKADFNIDREEWEINYTGMADDLIAQEINFKVDITGNI